MEIITSWDDYSPHNLRLAELLKKYKLPAIFFIDCGSDEAQDQIRNLADQGFEIGAHTYGHPMDLKILNDEQLELQIVDCRKFLQKIARQSINWFCYPRGRYDDRVKGFVERAGFKKARTTAVEIPWALDRLALPTSIHCYNRKEYKGKDWLRYAKYWIKFLDGNFKAPANEVHIWGHAWEIDKYGDWEKLEKLFKWISRKYL